MNHFANSRDRQRSSRAVTASASRQNRPFHKTKFSTFNMILALVLLAAVTVFYVSNTIAVDRLSAEINSLQSAYGEIRNMNIILNKEIDRKKSMERITAIARNRLGMVMPKEVPVWFDLDETRLRSADK